MTVRSVSRNVLGSDFTSRETLTSPMLWFPRKTQRHDVINFMEFRSPLKWYHFTRNDATFSKCKETRGNWWSTSFYVGVVCSKDHCKKNSTVIGPKTILFSCGFCCTNDVTVFVLNEQQLHSWENNPISVHGSDQLCSEVTVWSWCDWLVAGWVVTSRAAQRRRLFPSSDSPPPLRARSYAQPEKQRPIPMPYSHQRELASKWPSLLHFGRQELTSKRKSCSLGEQHHNNEVLTCLLCVVWKRHKTRKLEKDNFFFSEH